MLNRIPRSGETREADYRNPNSVYMKLGNFLSLDPEYRGRGKKGLSAGGRLDKVVWEEFASEIDRLRTVALRIVEAMDVSLDDWDQELEEAVEGKVLPTSSLLRTQEEPC